MTALEIAKLVCTVELQQTKFNTQLKALEDRLKKLSTLGIKIPITLEMDGQSRALLGQLGGMGRGRGGGGGGGMRAGGGDMQAGGGGGGKKPWLFSSPQAARQAWVWDRAEANNDRMLRERTRTNLDWLKQNRDVDSLLGKSSASMSAYGSKASSRAQRELVQENAAQAKAQKHADKAFFDNLLATNRQIRGPMLGTGYATPSGMQTTGFVSGLSVTSSYQAAEARAAKIRASALRQQSAAARAAMGVMAGTGYQVPSGMTPAGFVGGVNLINGLTSFNAAQAKEQAKAYAASQGVMAGTGYVPGQGKMAGTTPGGFVSGVGLTNNLTKFNAAQAKAQAAAAAQAQAAAMARRQAIMGNVGSFGTGAYTGLGGMYALNPYMAAGQAVGLGVAASVRSAANSEYFEANIGRISGYGRGQRGALTQGLYDIGQRVPVGINEIRGIAEVGARQGIGRGSPDELVKFTEALAKIKLIVPDMETEKLATDLSRIMNLFNITADNAEGLGSAIAKLDQETTASAKDIIDIMGRISGAANILGMGPARTAAIASIMKDAALRNESGSTAAMRLFNNLESNPNKIISGLGITNTEFIEAGKSGPDGKMRLVLDRIQKAVSGGYGFDLVREMGFKNQRDVAFLTQFGAAMGPGGRRVDQLTRMAEGEISNPQASIQATAVLSNTLSGSFERLKNAADQLGTAIGNTTNGPFKDFTDMFARIMSDLSKGNPQTLQTSSDESAAKLERQDLPPIGTGMKRTLVKELAERARKTGSLKQARLDMIADMNPGRTDFLNRAAVQSLESVASTFHMRPYVASGPPSTNVTRGRDPLAASMFLRDQLGRGMSPAVRDAMMASNNVAAGAFGRPLMGVTNSVSAYDFMSYDQKMRSKFGLNEFTKPKDRGDLTMSSTVDFIGKQQMDILSGDLQKQQLEAQKEANKILMDIAKSGGMNIGGAIAMAAIGGTA